MPHLAAFTKMINWHAGYCSFENSEDGYAEINGKFLLEDLKIIVSAMEEYQAAEAAKSDHPTQTIPS